jgi:hypothetical protein
VPDRRVHSPLFSVRTRQSRRATRPSPERENARAQAKEKGQRLFVGPELKLDEAEANGGPKRRTTMKRRVFFRADKRSFKAGQRISTAGEFVNKHPEKGKLAELALERSRPAGKPKRGECLMLLKMKSARLIIGLRCRAAGFIELRSMKPSSVKNSHAVERCCWLSPAK